MAHIHVIPRDKWKSLNENDRYALMSELAYESPSRGKHEFRCESLLSYLRRRMFGVPVTTLIPVSNVNIQEVDRAILRSCKFRVSIPTPINPSISVEEVDYHGQTC